MKMLYPILKITFDYFCEIFLKKLAIILFVSFTTISAGAANWITSGSTPAKGVYTYVDTESISTQGKYKQVFSKLINIPDEYYMVTLSFYDCKSNPKRTRNTYLTQYDLEGNVILSGEVPGDSFKPVLPESILETQTNIVCNF